LFARVLDTGGDEENFRINKQTAAHTGGRDSRTIKKKGKDGRLCLDDKR